MIKKHFPNNYEVFNMGDFITSQYYFVGCVYERIKLLEDGIKQPLEIIRLSFKWTYFTLWVEFKIKRLYKRLCKTAHSLFGK